MLEDECWCMSRAPSACRQVTWADQYGQAEVVMLPYAYRCSSPASQAVPAITPVSYVARVVSDSCRLC